MIDLRNKTFIFDVDGVILNSMHSHCTAWREAAMKQGFLIDSKEIYLREGEKGEVSAKYFLELHKKDSTPDAIRRFLNDKEEIFHAMSAQCIYPYIEEIFELLAEHSNPVALVTGSSLRELKRHLPPAIFQQCSVKVTGDMVTCGKPHPEPYMTALQELGIQPDEAVVIENAPYGIASAKAAGIYCIGLTTSLPHECLAEADYIIRSTKELLEVIQQQFLVKS